MKPGEGTSISMATLFQVILHIPDIERAKDFYSQLLLQTGQRISEEEHSFDCGGVILTCQGAAKEEAPTDIPNSSTGSPILRLSVPDLGATFERVKSLDCVLLDEQIVTEPWGARSFRVKDFFGNLITFVDEQTMQQQLAETRGTLETRTGMPLYLYSLQHELPTRVPGRVVRILPGEIWLLLSLAQASGAPRFTEGEMVRLQYEDAGKAYRAETRIMKVSALANEYVAIAVPEERLL